MQYGWLVAEVSRTELNQQTSRVLARVSRGERLVITDRGHPVAELAPPSASRWDDAVASGAVDPPRAHGPLPFEAVESEVSTADMLTDLRNDHS